MNTALEQTILERLHALDDARLAEVLDFVEFLRHRMPPQTPLTGLFSPAPAAFDVADSLAELRRERADSLEHTLNFLDTDDSGPTP